MDGLKDLVAFFSLTSGQIDTLWNVFLGVHVAIFGGLAKFQKELSIVEKVVIVIAYGVFSMMNGRAIYYNYELFNNIISDLSTMAAGVCGAKLNIISYFIAIKKYNGFITVLLLHGSAAMLVLSGVFFHERLHKNRNDIK